MVLFCASTSALFLWFLPPVSCLACVSWLQTTDDIVSSAECSSDDEDLEECDSGHAGPLTPAVKRRANVHLAHSGEAIRPCPRPSRATEVPFFNRAGGQGRTLLFPVATLLPSVPANSQQAGQEDQHSSVSLQRAKHAGRPCAWRGNRANGSGPGGELVIPVLVEDPLDIPPVSTLTPYLPLPPTLRPVLTIIETTKEPRAVPAEAGAPCLSDRGSDDCDDDDGDDDDGDGLVISGFGSGEALDSSLPPTDDEDFYTTFSLVTDKILTTSAYDGGYKAHAPEWEAKDFRPSAAPGAGRTTGAPPALLPDLQSTVAVAPPAPGSASQTPPRIPAGKMNNREVKPPSQPGIVLLPLPTSYDADGTKPRGPLITSPMLRNVPDPLPTVPGVPRVPPDAREVIRESSSTTGMVVGIVSAAALCILILLYAMYKYRNRDEGSYQVDETRNYISNSAQTNGAVVKDKQSSAKGANSKRPKDKDKEYYV
ncbi:hypothetical protein ACEWY4_027685 [Coilia grayii]|uniref:Neurexin/syndecan/glycophorin C domain-containing protein n=1 Tax=Coilia grayii TaxID=363190 RepID=A0ABD1IQ22_9TELE